MSALAVRPLFAEPAPNVRPIAEPTGAPTRPAFAPEPEPEPHDPEPEIVKAWEARERELADTMDKYVASLAELIARAQTLDTRLATEAVELGMAVAGELLARELSADRDLLVDSLENAVRSFRGASSTVIARLSPSDAEYVQSSDHPPAQKLEIVADPTITIGGFILEADDQFLNATTESRLELVRLALVEDRAGDVG